MELLKARKYLKDEVGHSPNKYSIYLIKGQLNLKLLNKSIEITNYLPIYLAKDYMYPTMKNTAL